MDTYWQPYTISHIPRVAQTEPNCTPRYGTEQSKIQIQSRRLTSGGTESESEFESENHPNEISAKPQRNSTNVLLIRRQNGAETTLLIRKWPQVSLIYNACILYLFLWQRRILRLGFSDFLRRKGILDLNIFTSPFKGLNKSTYLVFNLNRQLCKI